MECVETFWNVVECLGMFWNVEGCVGTLWNAGDCGEVCENVVVGWMVQEGFEKL